MAKSKAKAKVKTKVKAKSKAAPKKVVKLSKKPAAKKAVDRLKLETGPATGPLIGTLKVDDVLAAVMTTKGTVERGQAIYAQLGCANCHTVSPNEPQRGPILSQVATIYKRRELAESILLPSKSIAQGFAANRFILKDDTEIEGFVTLEAADKIVARLVTAQEVVIKPSDIVKRQKLEKSLMPEGLAAGISVSDLDLVELNEAFAPQSIACIHDLGLDLEKVNVNGGAIALGHPLGCSGVRIATTLIHEMKKRNSKYGLASMCIGVGQGAAVVFEGA